MDFLPPLHTRLERLGANLFEPLGKIGRRKQRLSIARHDRSSLAHWREVRQILMRAGMPEASFRIAGSPEGRSFFMWDPKKTKAVIHLPTRKSALQMARGMNYGPQSEPWTHLMVLLHEWGHARLHPPEDYSWGKALSPQARLHADPAWLQVDDYVGWRVFNEIFADAFSAAWLLKLSAGAAAATELLRAMRDYRDYQAQHFDHPAFPCLHPTAGVLDRVLSEEWQSGPDDVMARTLAMADASFVEWLGRAKRPGLASCDLSLSKLHMMEHQQRLLGGIVRGRGGRYAGFAPSAAMQVRLRQLREDLPEHPLLGFRGVQLCLETDFANEQD